MAYLDVPSFRDRTVMTPEDVDDLHAGQPAFLSAKLAAAESTVNAKLAKRYDVPFGRDGATVPEIVLDWIERIVTPEAYLRRGVDPSDAQMVEVFKAADRARAELQEAADSEQGRTDLPLRGDAPGASGVSRGGPLAYSEASPYTWTDVQAEALRG